MADVFSITTEGSITDKGPMLYAWAYFSLAKQGEAMIYASGGLS